MSRPDPDDGNSDDESGDLGEQQGAPAVGPGTDIDADGSVVEEGARGDTPATSDPDEYVEDGALGGTGGPSPGGAG